MLSMTVIGYICDGMMDWLNDGPRPIHLLSPFFGKCVEICCFHVLNPILCPHTSTRMFHKNKKLEFHLTTVDLWYTYLKIKISKFPDSGFLLLQAIGVCHFIAADFNRLGGRKPELESFDICTNCQLWLEAVDGTTTFCSYETPLLLRDFQISNFPLAFPH